MELDLTECMARREWASQHLGRLRAAVKAYEHSNPYAIRQDFDSRAYASSVYITPTPVSLEISFMAGDVIHNLRSALDHLAWQLALAIDPRAPVFPLEDDPDGAGWRGLYFPLGSKPDDADDWLPKRLRGASDDIKAFLRDVQAVAAADNPRDATVWKLQELSKADKHRVPLIAVPSLHQTDTLTITTPYSRVNSRILELARVPLMLEGETLLVRVGYDTIPLSKPIVELEHAIWVAFHDRLGIGPGIPIVDMLDMMEAMVDYILTRARQIGANGSRMAEPESRASDAAPAIHGE
jgi:hypothetical protein